VQSGEVFMGDDKLVPKNRKWGGRTLNAPSTKKFPINVYFELFHWITTLPVF
jgi:hypothetical protein